MYKLRTDLKHFRFNSVHDYGTLTVMWYKLIEDEENSYGVCLTQQELDQLIYFVLTNPINFSNPNYFACSEEDGPFCSTYEVLLSSEKQPANVILSKLPQRPKQGGIIYSCMDIELLDVEGKLSHTYALSFDLIGEIID